MNVASPEEQASGTHAWAEKIEKTIVELTKRMDTMERAASALGALDSDDVTLALYRRVWSLEQQLRDLKTSVETNERALGAVGAMARRVIERLNRVEERKGSKP